MPLASIIYTIDAYTSLFFLVIDDNNNYTFFSFSFLILTILTDNRLDNTF